MSGTSRDLREGVFRYGQDRPQLVQYLAEGHWAMAAKYLWITLSWFESMRGCWFTLRDLQKRSIIEFTMKYINPDEKMTFAYLNKDEVPVLCSWFEWKEWWKREADRCRVRYDRIDDWEIETRFQGCSTALDGPPLFWKVSFFSPRIVSDGARHFGTKESALAFHAEVAERIMSGEFE